MSSYTYLLIYEDMDNDVKGQTIAKFLWWAVHDGQQIAKDLGYAPLPSEVVAKAEAKIRALKAKGAPALPPADALPEPGGAD